MRNMPESRVENKQTWIKWHLRLPVHLVRNADMAQQFIQKTLWRINIDIRRREMKPIKYQAA